MTTPELVRLRNGLEVGESTVATTNLSLIDLFESGISGVLAVHELSKAAKIEGGKVEGGETLMKLINLGLVKEDGSIHDDIRQIVINSVEGEGLKMHLVNPLQSNG